MTPAIIAHRGFSSRHVENTMPAIRGALELGVGFVEVDVHETSDGKLVVFHDFRLDRICGVRGRVRDATLAAMKRLDPTIPSLREVLLACRGRARVLVEIKRADPRKVAAEIEACGMEREVIVFALSMKRMKLFAAANPRIPRFALVARRLPRRLPFDADGVGASRRLVRSRAAVERVHARGWKLFVWTVNREREMRRLAEWGVDGLITNYPDRAKSCLARRRALVILQPCYRSSSAP
jgi:glycerophosphoryl diester phosphodiesterase